MEHNFSPTCRGGGILANYDEQLFVKTLSSEQIALMQTYKHLRRQALIEGTILRCIGVGVLILIFLTFKKYWGFDHKKCLKDHNKGFQSNAFKSIVLAVVYTVLDLFFIGVGVQFIGFFFSLYQIMRFFNAFIENKGVIKTKKQSLFNIYAIMCLPLGYLSHCFCQNALRSGSSQFMPDIVLLFCSTIIFPILTMYLIHITISKLAEYKGESPQEYADKNFLKVINIIIVSTCASYFISNIFRVLNAIFIVLEAIHWLFSQM